MRARLNNFILAYDFFLIRILNDYRTHVANTLTHTHVHHELDNFPCSKSGQLLQAFKPKKYHYKN